MKADRFSAVLGNPEAKIEDYSELIEVLTQFERYDDGRFHGASALCSR